MIKIVVGHTNAVLEFSLGYYDKEFLDARLGEYDSDDMVFYSFENVIRELEEIQSDALTIDIDLSDIIWLFKEFEVVSGSSIGSVVYIPDKENFCRRIEHRYASKSHKAENIYQAWHILLFNLAQDIDEFFRYNVDYSDYRVDYLRKILQFLTNTTLYSIEDEFLKSFD